MYRHNPLPQNITRNLPKVDNLNHTNIVLSSPKFDLFQATLSKNRIHKISKSESKQKSLHRINSKQKPVIFTPSRKSKNLQISTAQHQPSEKVYFGQGPAEESQPAYFSINSLLKNKQKQKKPNDRLKETKELKKGEKRSFGQKQKIVFLKNSRNSFSQTVKNKYMNRIKQQRETIDKLSLNGLIEANYWEAYEGEVKENMFHGFGSLYFPNGNKFVGFFSHHRPEGHGSYYKGQSECPLQGIWSGGQLIQTI